MSPPVTRRLALPEEYDFAGTVSPLPMGRHDPCVRIVDGTFWWVSRTPDGVGTLALQRDGAGLLATGYGPGAAWVVEQADAVAGLRDDVSGFASVAAKHPLVAQLARRHRGLRLPATGRVYQWLLRTILEHRARPFLFSTSHPPGVAAACLAAIDVLEEEPELIDRLWENTRHFKSGLERLGFDTGHSETPITPVIVGGGALAHRFSDRLFEEGVFAMGIGFPTVPEEKSRVRTIVTAETKAPRTVELAGTVIADPNSFGRVQSGHPGRIEAPQGGLAFVGKRVRKGDLLAQLQRFIEAYDKGNMQGEIAQRANNPTPTPADNTDKNDRDRDPAALTPGDQGENEADRTITQKIRQAVVANDTLSMNAKNVKIITNDGTVTLRGPVKSEKEKSDIEAKAKQVAGVKRVDNQLEVAI